MFPQGSPVTVDAVTEEFVVQTLKKVFNVFQLAEWEVPVKFLKMSTQFLFAVMGCIREEKRFQTPKYHCER